jgi:lipopolysaccharide export system protein LptA
MGRLGRQATALALLGAAVLAGAALSPHAGRAAEAAGGGGAAFGSGNGPIDISADQAEYVDAENRAVWKGNVEVIQGMSRIRTPLLTIFYNRGASPSAGSSTSIQRMEAEGPVYYVTPTQNARGDHATYEAATHTMVMTGNVVLVQDKNVVQGDRLTVDTSTNHAVLVSNAQGRTAGKRVRGVFYPSQSDNQGAQTPAARP